MCQTYQLATSILWSIVVSLIVAPWVLGSPFMENMDTTRALPPNHFTVAPDVAAKIHIHFLCQSKPITEWFIMLAAAYIQYIYIICMYIYIYMCEPDSNEESGVCQVVTMRY